MKKIRFLLSVFFLICLGFNTMAQNKITIRGTVVDENNVSVINANVIEKGTRNSTITDLSGNFSLNVSSADAIIQFSSVGYEKLEVPVSEFRGVKRIILKESAIALSEVVAIGYGQVRKSDATGSVVAIKADEINRGLAVSPADLLLGKTAGVAVTTDGGAPGSKATIRIRGGSSMSASNDPLIVIDGVPCDNRSISGASDPLSTINPNDIETFTVLKDASSTAIYGSRASNGVIIITTKKGAAAKGTTKPKVTYNGTASVSTVAKSIDVMTADEFRNLVISQYGEGSEKAAILGSANTDWQKEIYRTAFSTDQNLSATGAYMSVPYRVSADWLSQQGILLTTKMDRSALSFNLNPTFLDNRLKFNINAKGMLIKNRFGDQGAIGAALEMDPTQPVHATGSYGNGYYISMGTNGKPNDIAIANPVSVLEQKEDLSTVKRLIANAQVDYTFKLLPELRANLNLGTDRSSSDGSVLKKANSVENYCWGDYKDGLGEYNPYTQEIKNDLLDYYMNYVKDISAINSKIDLMAGYSWQHIYRESTNDYFLPDKETSRKAGIVDKTEFYLVSTFGRLNYTLMNKYLLTFTLRDDASSRFSPDTRHGLFPSAAFAWKINEEPFMQDFSKLNDLKLRLGYGVTGQQDIVDNDYPYMARYESSQAGASYMFGDNAISLIRPRGYDSRIKWEETETYNVGIDYGFLNGRIAGSIDAYYRKTNDMINTIPVAAGTNFINELLTNVGNMTNKGIEFVINTKPVMSRDFSWDLGFNMSYNKNEITKLTRFASASYKGVQAGGISGGTGNYIQMNSVGYPVKSFYVYKQVYNTDGNPIEGAYVDLNGDGQITTDDLYHFKKAAPDFIFGLTSKIMYKSWDFSFTARSNIGNYVYNNVKSTRENLSDSYYSGFLKNRMKSAIKTNFNSAQYISDYYIEDGSFVRIDNITLGYNLNKPFGTSVNARIFLTAQNPVLITKYSGLDPEIFDGIDKNIYPRPFTLLGGLTVNF